MKRPPMLQDAERLAAQGRFGDTMLVHMNPKEVQGIASLMPGGRLTTNPVTGQPEAFIGAIAALAAKAVPFIKGAVAAKGAYDAIKGPKGTGQTAANTQAQKQLNQYTQDILKKTGQSKAFGIPQTLSDMVASGDISKATSFLPQGASGLNLSYQGLPGQMYTNYQTPEKFGEKLAPFGMPVGEPMPTPQIGGIADLPTEVDEEVGVDVDLEERDSKINEIRERLGIPSMGSYEDMVPKPIPKPPKGNIGRQQKIKRENAAALKKWEEGKKEFEALTNQFRYGGIAMLSKGGEMDFPRMNGPISGPGTETSDDIPAMLSDGEFVVNAKAVRGVGKLGGANKSKTDQRKEGARMMYALQRAGEQAMRGAS